MPGEPVKGNFDPPVWNWPEERRWVLAAAYGDRLPDKPECRSELLSQAASSMGLAARIAARWSRDLDRRLDSSSALEFRRARTKVEGTNLRLDAGLELVEQELAALGAAAVLLKGMALRRLGWSPAGGRPMVDIDLLLDPSVARQLQVRLQAIGFASAVEDLPGKHLPTLTHEEFGVIELHRAIPGLGSLNSPVDFQSVRDSLIEKNASRVYFPEPFLLAAHAIAHGWLLEGHLAGSRVFTMLGDLMDISAAQPLDQWWSDAMHWLPTMPGVDQQALQQICADWRATTDLSLSSKDRWNPATWAAAQRRIVDHALALEVDKHYRWSLRSHGVWRQGSARATSKILHLLWPSAEVLIDRWGIPPRVLGGSVWRLRWFGHLAVSGSRFLYGWSRTKVG